MFGQGKTKWFGTCNLSSIIITVEREFAVRPTQLFNINKFERSFDNFFFFELCKQSTCHVKQFFILLGLLDGRHEILKKIS